MKKIHMIGNSHIDPVWFWDQNEGLQEIRATLKSAVDRIKEFENFKFTFGFTCYMEWIEKVDKELFEEIVKYEREGRIEFISGMYIESDAILPSGELMSRQVLHGQKETMRMFGSYSEIGFFVDTFSTSPNIAKIFKSGGINKFLLNRPSHILRGNLFNLVADDGSSVKTIKLPGEYTTWFSEKHLENIESSKTHMENQNALICPYGVGNHGGGPTIENIKYIENFAKSEKNFDVVFSTVKDFFDDINDTNIFDYNKSFEASGEWNFSVTEFKQILFKAEKILLEVEKIVTFASSIGFSNYSFKVFNELEKVILFNQFHDIIAGTSIKEAMEEASFQLGGCIASLQRIKFEAIQFLKDNIDTSFVKGVPLIIFNFDQYNIKSHHEVELNWWCKDELALFDGEVELQYQVTNTSMTMMHKNLGGRRKIIFESEVPAFKYKVLDLVPITPKFKINSFDYQENRLWNFKYEESKFIVENLQDSRKFAFRLKSYIDEGNSWVCNEEFKKIDKDIIIDEVKNVSGGIKNTIRVKAHIDNSKFVIKFSIFNDFIDVKINIISADIKKAYSFIMENDFDHVEKEQMSGIYLDYKDQEIRAMGRSILLRKNEKGILIENDGLSAYRANESDVELFLLRCSMYAFGDTKDWWNENYDYFYSGIGQFEHNLRINFNQDNTLNNSNSINNNVYYLQDYKHTSNGEWPMINIENSNIKLLTMKISYDNNEKKVIRFLNTSNKQQDLKFHINNSNILLNFGSYELKTLVLEKGVLRESNILED